MIKYAHLIPLELIYSKIIINDYQTILLSESEKRTF